MTFFETPKCRDHSNFAGKKLTRINLYRLKTLLELTYIHSFSTNS